LDSQPASSTSAHVVLKAVSLLEEQGVIDNDVHAELQDKTRFEALMWRIRDAFFAESRNIAEFKVLKELAESVGIDWQRVFNLVENGEAYAALYRDEELKQQYCLQGSPSFVLNEGRQILYGNVGYRIIEANVTELLERKDHLDGASWC
jgi:predicted DsbA family dithiol-disulfide isomerase